MYIRRSVKHIDIDGKEVVYRSVAQAAAAVGITPPTIHKYAQKRLYLQDGSRFEFVPLRMKPRHHLSISFKDPAEATVIEKLSRKLKTNISDTVRVLVKIGLQHMPEEWADNVASKAAPTHPLAEAAEDAPAEDSPAVDEADLEAPRDEG